jgi:hypothetical protein
MSLVHTPISFAVSAIEQDFIVKAMGDLLFSEIMA